MKKQYVPPLADKVDFDYEENVVASNTPDNPPIIPPDDPCPCQGLNIGVIVEIIVDFWNRYNPFRW